jgi:hypothetical protein
MIYLVVLSKAARCLNSPNQGESAPDAHEEMHTKLLDPLAGWQEDADMPSHEFELRKPLQRLAFRAYITSIHPCSYHGVAQVQIMACPSHPYQ